jgi:hypothetical protein
MKTAVFGVPGAGDTVPEIVIGCETEYVETSVLTLME